MVAWVNHLVVTAIVSALAAAVAAQVGPVPQPQEGACAAVDSGDFSTYERAIRRPPDLDRTACNPEACGPNCRRALVRLGRDCAVYIATYINKPTPVQFIDQLLKACAVNTTEPIPTSTPSPPAAPVPTTSQSPPSSPTPPDDAVPPPVPIQPAPAPFPAAPSPPPDTGGSGVSTGVVAGIAAGVAVAAAAAGLVGFVYYRRRKQQRQSLSGGSSKKPGDAEAGLPGSGMGRAGGKGAPPMLDDFATASFLAESPFAHKPSSAAATASTIPAIGGMASPPTPPVSTGANAQTSLTTQGSGRSWNISQDPLMSYIVKSQMSNASGYSGLSHVTSAKGSGHVDVQPWEVAFKDIVIEKPIGEGSFGRVYLANWHETAVAVKVLLMGANDISDADGAQRALTLSTPIVRKMEEEASLLASLRHPNIVSFYGITRMPPAIITEYCTRGSLVELLGQARQDADMATLLTWPVKLSMALDAARGMLYLHTRPSPVIHRDLKSPNLLVDENWRVKVTDFNLSRIMEDSTHSTSMAAMNPRWLAPEVMQGERAVLASDVFSYAVVLWEILTYELPWGAANPWQLVSLVVGGGRLEIPPREALPGPDTAIFEGLDAYIALMKRCWAQSPLDRPRFDEIIKDLKALLEQTTAGGTQLASMPTALAQLVVRQGTMPATGSRMSQASAQSTGLR